MPIPIRAREDPLSRNQLVLLDKLLEQRHHEQVPPVTQSTLFEIFSAEQALFGYELSQDEIESGVVGAGRDGGLDGVYVFLGRDLLAEDSDVFDPEFRASSIPRETALHLVLVQAKVSEGF